MLWTLCALCTLVSGGTLDAQWSHRYPKIAGLSHHVYLEGYELPLLTNGPIDPAPAPDGKQVAFASRGWLWLLDLATGDATRLTTGAGMDSRPSWSPDGRTLAFVRDDTKNTTIVLIELASKSERVVVNEPAINLDPTFAPDGKSLFYSSAAAGDLDIWRLDLTAGTKTRITTAKGQELRPLVHRDGNRLVYLFKDGTDEVRIRNLSTGEERTLAGEAILSQTRPALSPDGRTLAVNWPGSDAKGWELRLMSVDHPGPFVVLTRGHGLPLTPAWSADGRSIFYVEADSRQQMELYQISAGGGDPHQVSAIHWSWGTPTGTLRIRTQRSDGPDPAPARIAVRAENGHPLLANGSQVRFDGQNGIPFFYSTGVVDLEVPVGAVDVSAVQGLTTPEQHSTVTVAAGAVQEVSLTLTPVWNPRADGWLAGDHHFHLNYGGPYNLAPEELVTMAAGEDMDVLTPLLANLHTRFEDQQLWTWRKQDRLPFIQFGQEVRPHFFGHMGLVGTQTLHWPWIYGPPYEVYGTDDRPNREVLEFARRESGLNVYVHPIMAPNPFSEEGLKGIPVAFVADAVQGYVDALEVACLWSDEIGSMEVWYRLLNIGVPMALSAGTDVMNNLYRTMAIGTTRVYARVEGTPNFQKYLDALRAGRSFVTTGPLLDFKVAGLRPGEVLTKTKGKVAWSVDLHTAVPVEKVEIVVNGAVVATFDGLKTAGSKTYSGSSMLPTGGWIAARAVGGNITAWPAMDSYAFAHTGPIWIGKVGSTDPTARAAAAHDLLKALDVANRAMVQSYQGIEIPRLAAHFEKARTTLEQAARP